MDRPSESLTTNPVEQPTMFIFGAQVLSPTKDCIQKILRPLSHGLMLEWILDAVAGLPAYWEALAETIPEVAESIPGDTFLSDLESWLKHGLPDDEKVAKLPNIILTPIVIISQLTQYWRYLTLQHFDPANPQKDLQEALAQGHQAETLGFCTGLLSSFAIASSGSEEQFKEYGAVAVRLAMLIGALADAQEGRCRGIGQGRSVVYATAWRNNKQAEDVVRVVEGLSPEAYISVLWDEDRATVTASKRKAPVLTKQLREIGVTAVEVGLKARVHNPHPNIARHTEALIKLCNKMDGLAFPDAACLPLNTYANEGGPSAVRTDAGKLHEIALRAVLMRQCQWYPTFSAVVSQQHTQSNLVSFGPEHSVPPSLTQNLQSRIKNFSALDSEQQSREPLVQASIAESTETTASASQEHHKQQPSPRLHSFQPSISTPQPTEARTPASRAKSPGNDPIAIVGMSIKVAGADDVNEFSLLLRGGESQHEAIGPDRMKPDSIFRDPSKSPPKLFGNFIRDRDAFDHKFFKRSPRESASMDPQQRLFFQGAYQAVEQSGYFTEPDRGDKAHVGVYVGCCSCDYEHHATCHAPNAFTATGLMRSFIPGKWTGPAMVFDTACSASAVAIHTACRALWSGECAAALCGGIATMTNIASFQDLSQASFLSPTGQCKPFDAAADGYCRGEGVACVFLKRMSDAVADGNPIYGCIGSTGVHQNQNSTPIFVPNSPSLSRLFSQVMKDAAVTPRDISLVEAHGTGTPVGDPAEYESIRIALGGPNRGKKLPIGSIKGQIGHTEGASGVIALIKIIAMMRGGFLPKQASFTSMNPSINARSDDMMEVLTSARPWDEPRKIALLNNYGASGSNASMIVMQSPFDEARSSQAVSSSTTDDEGVAPRIPFWIGGSDARSISSYCIRLEEFLQTASPEEATLPQISFGASRRSNRGLQKGIAFSSRTVEDLKDSLREIAANNGQEVISVPPERPVILCFGGQVSTFVGLDRKVYENAALLRYHLDECDHVIKSLGLETIYPDIFSKEPIENTVKLQTMLFSMQYAVAKAWMNSGLEGKVKAVVGHSFGEITALCVSEVLSLEDTVKLVAGRATVVRDLWGHDRGAMMAVEADEPLIQSLVADVNGPEASADHLPVEIACYNGPRSFTLAGSTASIDKVAETIQMVAKYSGIKNKRLNVTNAFHSVLVEPLVERLEHVGKGLTFHDAAIPLERATEATSTESRTARFVSDHMRKPVFFNHAIQRLAQAEPNAIFLEAGSSSTITVMADRALSAGRVKTTTGGHHFQALNITGHRGMDGLTDATLALWKHGLHVSYWPHHALQAQEYVPLFLPPYQFEKSRHWLELKSPSEAVEATVSKMVAERLTMAAQGEANLSPNLQDDPRTREIWSLIEEHDFTKASDGSQVEFRFRINTESDKYMAFVSGHRIAQTAPICPATLQFDMAIEALHSVLPAYKREGFIPVMLDMVNHAPVCVNPSRTVHLEFSPLDISNRLWQWVIVSSSTADLSRNDRQVHAEAKLHFRDPEDSLFVREFARFERLVTHKHCLDLLRADLAQREDVEVLQGQNVYRAFSEVVDYGMLYRGVKCVVGSADESAGKIHKRHQGKTWLDVALSDCFSQVAGIWVNLMTDCDPGSMFIATGCEMSMRSPSSRHEHSGSESGPEVWHVLARHTRKSDAEYTTDVFIFDAETGGLAEVMLGIQYARVAKASMSKILARLTAGDKPESQKDAVPAPNDKKVNQSAAKYASKPKAKAESKKRAEKPAKANVGRGDITDDVRKLVAGISGAELHEVTPDSTLLDLGIDSLMGMELAREVEAVFKCALELTELLKATCLKELVICITNVLDANGDAAAVLDGDDVSDIADSDYEVDNTHDSSSPGSEGWSASDSEPGDGGPATPTSGQMTPAPGSGPGVGAKSPSVGFKLSRRDILDSFGEVKLLSDQLLRESGLDNMDKVVIAATNQLCTALVLEAFDNLGSPLRAATAGQVLPKITSLPQHDRLLEFVYRFLHYDARLIDIDSSNGVVTRTHIAIPSKTSRQVLDDLLIAYPKWSATNRLTHYAGRHLSDVLRGDTDGIKVIFGSAEGRELVQTMYCNHTFNLVNYSQMRDVIGRIAERLRKNPDHGETLKILEMGGGTGGTTHVVVPFLASLGIAVEYTFTDLSASMVASMRRKLGSKYPFMRFAVHDIERPPEDELKGQHLVLASNAVHATHNLVTSASNIHQCLRHDGFLMILEMTEALPFIDMIFGLLEGWWLFNDGRQHAIVSTARWEEDLHAAGFGHVDWTDGQLAEHSVQKVILALASGSQDPRLPKFGDEMSNTLGTNMILDSSREAEAEKFLNKYTSGWSLGNVNDEVPNTPSVDVDNGAVVILTGATGSLGSHMVQVLAENPKVRAVVCINRRGSMIPVEQRQEEAFTLRGISLSTQASRKLKLVECDVAKPKLGLEIPEYDWLVQNGTHIVHVAWPMSGTRPIRSFELQFQAMRNLIDLARDMVTRVRARTRVGFQFVSSIGVVGHSAETRVLERRVPLSAVLPNGYGEAKWVCEQMLDKTLHKYPQLFRPMVVRPGQIAGSTSSGYWNPAEHFAFIVKSSQSLRAWPDLDGILQWVPVDSVASTMMDLLYLESDHPPDVYPVYHIDNPVGQSWKAMSLVLADAIGVPRQRIVPFDNWVRMVRRSPLNHDTENPSAKLIDFISQNFRRMSCGGLILDTSRAQEHSRTMAKEGPVSADVARRFVRSWIETGFLR